MNSKAVSMPIVLLVIASLVLTITSLSYFLIKEESTSQIARGSENIDKIYLNKLKLDFYLQDIFEKTLLYPNRGEKEFMSNFRNELIKQKDKNGLYPIKELALVELNFNEAIEVVEINEGRVVLRMKLSLREGYRTDEVVSVTYNYIKEFSKGF